MAKRILVPLDQSSLAEAVLPLVGEVARGSGATVRLLHVAPIPDDRVGAEGRVIVWDPDRTRSLARGRQVLRVLPGGVAPRSVSPEADGAHAEDLADRLRGARTCRVPEDAQVRPDSRVAR